MHVQDIVVFVCLPYSG